ncbi:hypothetical protein Apa02nite_071440 [Actinoplanes palleronii]|uniref:Uncharacterized protein n=1 Tax=Actinoplanes palleronii TaxID=113570 RepID=A0ABQ4BL61_9ACTN|nr:hypothetical protein Apa02nite_071440 [Actinoplanes palleronii]
MFLNLIFERVGRGAHHIPPIAAATPIYRIIGAPEDTSDYRRFARPDPAGGAGGSGGRANEHIGPTCTVGA